jgi:hypothetical protein
MSALYCEDDDGNVYEIAPDGSLAPIPQTPSGCRSASMTDTAQGVYAYIIRYKQAHDGVAPTVREIMDACDVSSSSVVAYNLDKLVLAGLIRCRARRRHIEVVGGKWLPPVTEAQP